MQPIRIFNLVRTFLCICLFGFIVKSEAQTEYIVSGGLADLKSKLGCDNCTLILEGTFNINELLALDSKTDVTLVGRGAKWVVGQAFRFRIAESKNIRFENIDIEDHTPNIQPPEYTIFDFLSSTNSGIENIRYVADYAKRQLVRIRSHSSRCYVRSCQITKTDQAVMLGSPAYENSGAPTTECVVENNRITDFQYTGIQTQTLNQSYSLTNIDSHARHRISGNTLLNPNINNTAGVAAIDVNGSESTVEGNIVIGNPIYPSQAGIYIHRAYQTICRANRVTGKYLYAGIYLATTNNSSVSENTLDGVTSTNYYSSAILINKQLAGDPVSAENLISGNQVLNCKKGVFVEGADNTVISGNIFQYSSYGIYTTGSRFELRGNRFNNIGRSIYSSGGGIADIPNQITGNSFSACSSMVVFNENNANTGRPFLFEGNQVFGWGDISYPEAIVLRCGASRISGNTFMKDVGRNTTGFPIAAFVVATKSWGYGIVNGHEFKDNQLSSGVTFTINGNVGDKAGFTNNNGCCGTGLFTND